MTAQRLRTGIPLWDIGIAAAALFTTGLLAKAQMPGGETLGDIRGLKKFLRSPKDRFVRAIATKRCEYALGRHDVPADRPHIDTWPGQLDDAQADNKDLITSVVLSELFSR